MRAGRTGERARLAVEDTGIGIPAAALPYLFERFYQVDPSCSRTSGGSEIGLTIARHLASAGSDQGSTFTLLLSPAQTDQPHAHPH